VATRFRYTSIIQQSIIASNLKELFHLPSTPPGNSDGSQENPRKRKREEKSERVVEELNLEENAQGLVEPDMEEPAEIRGEKFVEVAINKQYMGPLQKSTVQVQSQSQSQPQPPQKIEEVQNVISMPVLTPVVKKRRFTPEELRAMEVAAENTVETKAEMKVELPAELGIDEFIGAGPIENVGENESNSGISGIISSTMSSSSTWSSNFASGTTVSMPTTSLPDDERLMYENEVAQSHAEENERLRLETEQLNAASLRAEENARLQVRENERLRLQAEIEAARSRVEESLRQNIATEQQNAARFQAEENARLQFERNERLRLEAEREASRSRAEEIERQRIEAEQQVGNERLRLEAEQQEAARSQAIREVERQRFEAERRISRLAAEQELRRLETDQQAAKSKADKDRQRLLGEYEEIAKREAREKEVVEKQGVAPVVIGLQKQCAVEAERNQRGLLIQRLAYEVVAIAKRALHKSNPVEILPVWPVPAANVIAEPVEQNKSLEVAAEIVVEKKAEINVERAAEIAIENDPFFIEPATKALEDKVGTTSRTVEKPKVASKPAIILDPKIQEARKQPKSEQEEAMLQAKYGSMEPGERAFAILLNLGMIEEHPDPDSPSYDSTFDNDPVPGMIVKRQNVDVSVAVKSGETEGKEAQKATKLDHAEDELKESGSERILEVKNVVRAIERPKMKRPTDPATLLARKQPKSVQEEATLQAKYGSMEAGERAFSILLDLGMIIAHPNPDLPNYDHNFDHDIVPSGKWV